ncbi:MULTISPECIES: organic hydroperoxide resistance protein [unclassified Pseudomonas]|uniref:organic hydroperoxide resistance protein n=1 Tax=unclassified Pseudomonas TaxID=196821 RepID=UPI002AC93ED3|nr:MULTISPECIES: organic hydroperoxide resistance protein [unclassified Pseudomonas]MEB0047537.1 organic hydroperoxide resistance protein [Pseudomonas sp. Dout3]MEB0097980.1 organic hydroperoxide resistance protein [Pseudomonas sp. DC1.2]WPX57007.1 organic hydroperoxide resistance protein [Pseudomonas sp. DC1.2]
MITKTLYQTEATAVGGRDGHARASDGSLNVWLGMPKELGGNGFGNNPEQLFAAGYAACFLSAMKNVARNGKHPSIPETATVRAQVGIGPINERAFGLAVTLRISLPGIVQAAAEALVEDAHQACPYSNSVRGNIDVKLEVVAG